MNIQATKVKPCDECGKQVTFKRNTKPHMALTVVEKQHHGARDGGWEETTYKCRVCGSLVQTTTDANEIAPFWWFI
jgi:DNA-directed RNA polymerase subunit RPC12/RpoP